MSSAVNMFRTLSFFVLITVIGHQIKADHVSDIYELPQASDEHLAIDMTSSEGMEIKFPFYSSDITSLLPEQRDLVSSPIYDFNCSALI